MKKVLAMMFLVALAFSLVSCSAKDEPKAKSSTTTTVNTTTNNDGSTTTTTTTTNSDGSTTAVAVTTHDNYTINETKVTASNGTYTLNSEKVNTDGTKEVIQEKKLADGSIAKTSINIAADGTPSYAITHKTSAGADMPNENIDGNYKFKIYLNGVSFKEAEAFYNISSGTINPFNDDSFSYQQAGKTIYFVIPFTNDDDNLIAKIVLLGSKQSDGKIEGEYQCFSIASSGWCENGGFSKDAFTLEPAVAQTIATTIVDSPNYDTYTDPSGDVLNDDEQTVNDPDIDLIETYIAKSSDNSTLYANLKVQGQINTGKVYSLKIHAPNGREIEFSASHNGTDWVVFVDDSEGNTASGTTLQLGPESLMIIITGIPSLNLPENFILSARAAADWSSKSGDKLKIDSILKF